MDVADVDRANDREWRQVLLGKLNKLDERLEKIENTLSDQKVDSATSKLKISLLALASGTAGGFSANKLKLLFFG